MAGLALFQHSASRQTILICGTAITLLFAPVFLEGRLISLDIPRPVRPVVVAVNLGFRRFRQRGLVNAVSGLPNL